MFQIKKVLEDIIDQAFPDNPNKEKYKKVFVEFTGKNSKTFHGYYTKSEKRIKIYNTYRNDMLVIAVLIHELAHHIHVVDTGDSDHSKEFYAIYRVLLFAALDMGLLNKDAVMEIKQDASDSNKVKKILSEYDGSGVDYKSDMVRIDVENGYKIREILKELGFIYNTLNTFWEKELPKSDLQEIETKLNNLQARYRVENAKNLVFKGTVYIYASGETYEFRNQLAAIGFHWSKNKKSWVKKVPTQDFDLTPIRIQFPTLQFKIK